jgi:hypothetical protein
MVFARASTPKIALKTMADTSHFIIRFITAGPFKQGTSVACLPRLHNAAGLQ